MPAPPFVDVAVELPIEGALTYLVPEELADDARVGSRVLVQLGKRAVTGYVVALKRESGVEKVKPLLDALDDEPLFDSKKLEFFKWLSAYYQAPLGEALSLIHPSFVNLKSVRTFHLTEEGALALAEGRAPGDRVKSKAVAAKVLEAVKDGASFGALSKRLKGAPIESALKNLLRAGFIIETLELKGGRSARTEGFVSIKPDAATKARETLASLKRAPAQAKIFSILVERKETPLKELKTLAGAAGHAITALVSKGFLELTEREVSLDTLGDVLPKTSDDEPSAEQKVAIDAIKSAMAEGGFSPFLLFGVTGSGKTLVYMHLLEEALACGKRAVMLVPEIALTPRAAAYLKARFPGRSAILHSGLNDAERYHEWQKVLAGKADVVVGTRSALFSPIQNLGLIIVDEEHDASYKQEEGIKYNGRDSAIMLARTLGIPVVLGSATPSVESFYNALSKKYSLLRMSRRVEGMEMPEVELVDMRGRKEEVIGESLKAAISEALSRNGQVLIFLNRRGFSTCLLCRDCGHVAQCLNCSVSLTLHKGIKKLKCHYCDMALPIPETCSECGGNDFVSPSAGTERVEEELRSLFPGVGIGRMDRDTTRKRGASKEILDAMDARRVSILIGTQMIAKGHDFPGITLVGVVSGDTSLAIPDFRGAERTFQLISQAGGRAGRIVKQGKVKNGGDIEDVDKASNPARVIIQTLNPEHFCFRAAKNHDYEAFYKEEIRAREECSYPPFTRLALVRIDGTNERRVDEAAIWFKREADAVQRCGKFRSVKTLGPAPALITRLKGRHRRQLLLKCRDAKELVGFVALLKKRFIAAFSKRATLSVDMDPLNTV
jgi:primosomal protein N' (replication factor Y)